MDFEAMWRDLHPLGRSSGGGYFRQPFASAERECQAWFDEQATARGLRLERDGNGNTVAWWDAGEGPQDQGRGVVTGSHLDSVLDGGAYDGPLGVVSGLAAIDRLREEGHEPARPIGVAVTIEEEGSRFGVVCLGTRLTTGRTTPEEARGFVDRDGLTYEDAMAAAGLEPDLGPSDLLTDVGCFVELHVEQGRQLPQGEAVGFGSMIWPAGRFRLDVTGRPDHAGATAMEDRADPMLTYAMTVLAANKAARVQGQRATFAKVEVAPNSVNGIPSRVTGWLDARAETEEALEELVGTIARQAQERAERDGTTLTLTAESQSGATHFDADLATRLAHGRPIVPSQAGHDAGILASAGVPAAMLFVRNPTGVSHSPDEHAETADCLAGVEALAGVLRELT